MNHVSVDFKTIRLIGRAASTRFFTRALFGDDRVVMQPTMITFPTLPSLPAFPSSPPLFGLKRPFQTIPFLSYHK